MKKKSDWRGSGSYATVGLDLVLSVLIGFFGGRWLDGRFGTEPWLSVLGFVFGTAAGFRSLWRGLQEMRQISEEEERKKGNPRPRYSSEDDREREATDDRKIPEDDDRT